jgi:hypothetical protein
MSSTEATEEAMAALKEVVKEPAVNDAELEVGGKKSSASLMTLVTAGDGVALNVGASATGGIV